MKNWINEMIEREATPKPLREETTIAFCKKNELPKSTYYYEANKKENWEKIEDLCFKLAKKYTADILDGLGQRATKDTRSAEVFMEFILERKKRMDLTSDDKPIGILNTIK